MVGVNPPSAATTTRSPHHTRPHTPEARGQPRATRACANQIPNPHPRVPGCPQVVEAVQAGALGEFHFRGLLLFSSHLYQRKPVHGGPGRWAPHTSRTGCADKVLKKKSQEGRLSAASRLRCIRIFALAFFPSFTIPARDSVRYRTCAHLPCGPHPAHAPVDAPRQGQPTPLSLAFSRLQ